MGCAVVAIKKIADKAADEAVAHEWKWSAEQDAIAKKECVDHGMKVSALTDEPKWAEAARNVWPDFYDKVGGKQTVDEVMAVINQGK